MRDTRYSFGVTHTVLIRCDLIVSTRNSRKRIVREKGYTVYIICIKLCTLHYKLYCRDTTTTNVDEHSQGPYDPHQRPHVIKICSVYSIILSDNWWTFDVYKHMYKQSIIIPISKNSKNFIYFGLHYGEFIKFLLFLDIGMIITVCVYICTHQKSSIVRMYRI